MRYVLTVSGQFQYDEPDDEVFHERWTSIQPMQPAYQPEYYGFQTDELTGECSGGAWVDPGAPTQEDLSAQALSAARAGLTAGVQGYLDTLARSIGYDSILSLCTYASSTNPVFAAEGQAGVVLRDGCWAVGHQMEADVIAGLRPLPTLQQVLDELPTVEWP